MSQLFSARGECGKEKKKQVQAGWNGWKQVSGVIRDQRVAPKVTGTVPQKGNETSKVVWLEDGDSDLKTRDRTGGGGCGEMVAC